MLERLARSHAAPHRQVMRERVRVLLMAADGLANTRIAEEVGVTPVTVRSWRKRFSEDGPAKLGQVRRGRGRKSTISDEQVAEIVRLITEEIPPGHTHWSCRTMGNRVRVSHSAVQRIWSDLGIKPHRVDTFKVSTRADVRAKNLSMSSVCISTRRKRRSCCADRRRSARQGDRQPPCRTLAAILFGMSLGHGHGFFDGGCDRKLNKPTPCNLGHISVHETWGSQGSSWRITWSSPS